MRKPYAPLLLAALLAVPLVSAAPASAEDPVPGKLLLMLDASGSMNGKDPSGLTKIAAAKKALTSVVDALPATAEVGLRVYGATEEGGKPTPKACADTQLVHPITTLDKPGLKTAINAFKAKGETPIAGSLEKAITDLGTTGKRNIVLVSDGEESCVPDPCPVVKKLLGNGIDLQLDTVGFAVNAKAKKQLQCLADAGHGTYYDAKNATALTGALTKLSQRALRPFQMQGTRISGGATPETATPINPGQYLDEAEVSSTANRFYRVTRTPGATLRATLTAKPPRFDLFSTDGWNLQFRSLDDGTACGTEDSGIRHAEGNSAVTASATLLGPDDTKTARPGSTPGACDGTELLLSVRHFEGADGATPYELILAEELPATGTASLPPPLAVADVPTTDASGQGSPRVAVGGGSFNDALTLAPGVFTDTFLPDEEVFYRVPLDFGQGAVVTFDVPDESADYSRLGFLDATTFRGRVWAPDRAELSTLSPWHRGSYALGMQGWRGKVTLRVPEVRYNNRHLTGFGDGINAIREASTAGAYYFTLRRDAQDNIPMVPVRITVQVTGTANGAPTYVPGADGPTPSPTPGGVTASNPLGPTTAGSSSTPGVTASGAGSGPGWTTLIGGSLIGLAAAAGIGFTVLRHRAEAADDVPA